MTASGTSHADLIDPSTGRSLATNDDDGVVDRAAVQRYLDADPLGPYGFFGWVGPETHGALLANAGVRRDPLIADRVVAWLTDRYARRRAGDPAALRPFLLVASFINPHDIVLFPLWSRRSPVKPSHLDPPPVPPAPIADEDLSTKPAAQIAFREAYYSGYARRRPSGAATGRARSATCITACTPRWTGRSTGSGGRSPKMVRRTRFWCAPPTTPTCSARTTTCSKETAAHRVWRAGRTGLLIRPRRCASGCRPTPRPTSRAWWSGWTWREATNTCGSWCAPSTIRAPGPNPAYVTWPPMALGGEEYRTSPVDD